VVVSHICNSEETLTRCYFDLWTQRTNALLWAKHAETATHSESSGKPSSKRIPPTTLHTCCSSLHASNEKPASYERPENLGFSHLKMHLIFADIKSCKIVEYTACILIRITDAVNSIRILVIYLHFKIKYIILVKSCLPENRFICILCG